MTHPFDDDTLRAVGELLALGEREGFGITFEREPEVWAVGYTRLANRGLLGAAPDLGEAARDAMRSLHAKAAQRIFPTECLVEKVSLEAAEAAHPGITDARVKRNPSAGKPFGFQNDKWEALKAAMKPGDELWIFSSSAKSFQDLAGRRGIVLLRDGEAVAQIVTLMS